MKYKVTFSNGTTETIEAEECRQSGGGWFKKPQWYDFGCIRIRDDAIDNRDLVFYIEKRINIDQVLSVEAKSGGNYHTQTNPSILTR